MRIETRFAWIISFCFLLGVTVAGTISFRLEARQARAEIKRNADLVLETATALRAFTADELTPTLRALNDAEFQAAQVPSFVAQSALKRVSEHFPEIRYRESALNPTQVGDRASDWEVGLLRQFRGEAALRELSGEHGEGPGQRFYVARPIRIASADCLRCHGDPAAAPPAMVARYGAGNGFGWQLGEVVAMQLVEVPTAPSRDKAWNSVFVTIGSLTCVFILSAAVFLLLLRRHVTSPLEALTRVARQQSLHSEAQDGALPGVGGQFGELQLSIQRLKLSLDRALRLFGTQDRPSSGTDH